MDVLTVKSLHIIFIVTWFAALFYGFRLFVYHAEADRKPEPERGILMRQYSIMERRLWHIIGWPSCILTFIFGFWLSSFHETSWVWSSANFYVKLFFVFGLLGYQIYGESVLRKLRDGIVPLTSTQFRLMNEIPTVVLIAVVFLIVWQDGLNWIWGTLGILGTASLLGFAVQLYKKRRAGKGEQVD